MSIPPKIAKQHKGIQKLGKNNYFFGQAIIIKIILDKIDPLNTWSAAIDNTIKSLSHIRIKQMGFSVDWQKIFEKNSF